MAQSSYAYENRRGIHPISWNDFHGLCKALAAGLADFSPELILAVGRGGYYAGTLLAHILQVELYPIRLSRRVLYAHQHGAAIPDYIGLISDELLLNPWDREIFRDGAFQFHPEYVGALKEQGIAADASLLIAAPPFQLAKG